MRAIFFGTPDIAVGALEALARIADVTLVVCQPDRPAGRGLALKAPAVKEKALALGIEVIQPTKVKVPEFAETIRAVGADIAVVMAYGRILTKAVLDAPRLGCVNLHASLLPKYRGAAPITWSVVDGETETGISLMQMDEGLDTGPVFTRAVIPIGTDETASDVSAALAKLAGEVVTRDVPRVVSGELTAVAQDHAKATHARLLDKNDGRIDFSRSARQVHDHVRGMTPWPAAFSRIEGKLFKLQKTRVIDTSTRKGEPGTVVTAEKNLLEIACGVGTIAIDAGQMEGKKSLEARDLVAGRTLKVGMRFEPGEPA